MDEMNDEWAKVNKLRLVKKKKPDINFTPGSDRKSLHY